MLSAALLSKSVCNETTQYSRSVSFDVTWPGSLPISIAVHITRTILPTGGLRAWFLCPGCNRRCARLYIVDQRDRELRCRLCLGLVYRVQYRKSKRHAVFRLVRKWLAEEQRRQQAQTKI